MAFLSSDYSLRCEGDKYSFNQHFAIFMTILYVIIVPAGMAWTKKFHAGANSNTTHGLLELPYKKNCTFCDWFLFVVHS